jgi:hypothetical protein
MQKPSQPFGLRVADSADISHLHRLMELSVRVLGAGDCTPRQIEGALGYALGLDTRLIEDATYFVAHPSGEHGPLVACGGWSRRIG